MPSTELYCTPELVRSAMNMTSTDDDAILTAVIGASSRLIDGYMGYETTGFLAPAGATVREYSTEAKRYAWIDPCVEITACKMKSSVSSTTYDVILTSYVRGFRGDPMSAGVEYNSVPYHGIVLLPGADRSRFLNGRYDNERGFDIHFDDINRSVQLPTLEVTARWGAFEETPDPIIQATIMQSIRLYKRQQGGMADALLTGDFTQQRFVSLIDKDVKFLLNSSRLKRPAFGGR